MGDARYNMGNSYMIACAKMGMDFVACAPKKYFPNEELVAQCQEYAKASGATITLTEDVMEGTKDADVICTDVWVSMGEPDEVWAERIKDLSPYKVTKEVMANGKKEAIFLHCLPSFHDLNTGIGKEMGERFDLKDMEVTDEVFQSEQSKDFPGGGKPYAYHQSGDGGNSGGIIHGVNKDQNLKKTAGDGWLSVRSGVV